ncbi:MAG: bifunctional [glutamine synthetase] adenylyltransferase/[glutamine synthetase]-adenylyl-L-tyrosine phosphorylase [Nitriliruptorales bacterium]|nr:bifunctional [glutamine synthetase] adenylyltransferase/[glutamine synthetase]-adenylyl-L-tyrosine phosphorylase [Nitriliruptorales bacterium]
MGERLGERPRSGRLQTSQARAVRLGLGAEALTTLEVLGAVSRPAGMALAAPEPVVDWPLVEAMVAGADPRRCLLAFDRLADRAPAAWAALWRHAHPDAAPGRPAWPDRLAPIARAALLAGASDALAGLLITDPGMLAILTGSLERHDAQRVCETARAALNHPGGQDARMLARAQRRGLARIATRDLLALADTPAIAAELSDLADGVLAAALQHVQDRLGLDVPLSVVAMGKLGGRELNYVSDVDVLFVCDGDHAAANRVAEAFLRLCGEVTPEGSAYEVDPNLRPEGRDGPLVRSLDGCRAYYERWASTWEFQALLKARPIAGDRGLGEAFRELVEPFVWPDRREPSTIEDIQRLKGVVEGSPKVRKAGEREVKLAPGGLRDIEFAVQLLQLVHGRHDPTLRQRGTLPALAALAAAGYIGEDDAELFANAYGFLRTVEHRLQLRALRRTHALPADEPSRQRLARTLGYADGPDARAVERFDADLRRARGDVRRLHEKLFYRPLLGRFAELRARDLIVPGTGRMDPVEVRDRLGVLGFADPEAALRHLEALVAGTSRRARLLRTLLPTMLPVLADTPDPDAGLAALRSLTERLDASPTLLSALRDRPPVAERLATVLGSSPLVGRSLERQPEVLPLLADETALARRREAAEYRRLAGGLVRRHDTTEGVSNALRRVARRELARTAIRDLIGDANLEDVAVELSGLAEACLQTAVATVTPPGVSLAVIGMGKLGGRELTYSSDLDVLFVFEPAEARVAALRAVERLLHLLSGLTPEGRAFPVDPNLRPEGKDGPLGRTLQSYQLYYQRFAQPWELQALTQARPVAGDTALGRAFVDVLAGLLYPAVVPEGRLDDVRAMKGRMERERPRARAAGIDLKLGPGGLTDVEWTVQLRQLAHGGRLPRLRRRGTVAALTACEAEGVVAESDARILLEGHHLLTGLRHALFLVGLRDTSTLPSKGPQLEHVARLIEPEGLDGRGLQERVIAVMREVRAVHERLFFAGDQ